MLFLENIIGFFIAYAYALMILFFTFSRKCHSARAYTLLNARTPTDGNQQNIFEIP
jgi:hypothetical protein